jgi:hypothetical protein
MGALVSIMSPGIASTPPSKSAETRISAYTRSPNHSLTADRSSEVCLSQGFPGWLALLRADDRLTGNYSFAACVKCQWRGEWLGHLHRATNARGQERTLPGAPYLAFETWDVGCLDNEVDFWADARRAGQIRATRRPSLVYESVPQGATRPEGSLRSRKRHCNGLAMGRCQPRSIAIKRIPRQSAVPTSIPTKEGRWSRCPITTVAPAARAATA